MQSPKSRQYEEKKNAPYRRRKHKNKKFYNSKAWKSIRHTYINAYEQKIRDEVSKGYWTTRDGLRMELEPHQISYILVYNLPCEICLKLYIAGAYTTIEDGKELDHIIPVNNENALLSKGHGNPLDLSNLQLLCYRHHDKKSKRETYDDRP